MAINTAKKENSVSSNSSNVVEMLIEQRTKDIISIFNTRIDELKKLVTIQDDKITSLNSKITNGILPAIANMKAEILGRSANSVSTSKTNEVEKKDAKPANNKSIVDAIVSENKVTVNDPRPIVELVYQSEIPRDQDNYVTLFKSAWNTFPNKLQMISMKTITKYAIEAFHIHNRRFLEVKMDAEKKTEKPQDLATKKVTDFVSGRIKFFSGSLSIPADDIQEAIDYIAKEMDFESEESLVKSDKEFVLQELFNKDISNKKDSMFFLEFLTRQAYRAKQNNE